MEQKTSRNKITKWLEKRLVFPNESEETKALKVRFVFYLISQIPVLSILAFLFWVFRLHHVALAMFFFILFELILTVTIILIRKEIVLFALINQYFFVVFSFVAVLYFGGIMHSGGVVLIGLAGVLQSLFFLKPHHIKGLFIVYIITVILETVLQSLLKQLPEITPSANLILFVLHLLVIASVLYSWLDFFIQQSIKMKSREAEHLKELDQIKTDFYTNITHEFRTPLTVILGLTNPDTKISRTGSSDYFPMIRRNAMQLLQLVNQMLDLSKLQAQTMKANYIQTDIISYLHQLIEPYWHLANEKETYLHFQSNLKELYMDFDPERMDSLVGNLLMNAIKYSSMKSNISFNISKLEGDDKLDSLGYSIFSGKTYNNLHLLKLEIKDTGIGITEEEIPLIFNRFYRVNRNKQECKEGAGIGLLLVKETVELLNGNLFISSSPGKGTKIVVILPITNNATQTEPVKSSPLVSTGKSNHPEFKSRQQILRKELPHLLIIEDNDDVVTYLKTITSNCYQIERAGNGTVGIEMALKNVPDIIISDILMPEKNGYEVCNSLKNDFRTSHIPIVLLTAKSDKSSEIEGFEKGADAYITKPFNPRELLVRLKKLIENRDKLKAKYRTLAIVSDIHQGKAPSPDEQFLIKTKQVLEKRFSDEDFNPVELSKHLGISRTQLFRKIKALTGLSASNFIGFYRVSVAREKIQKTNLNISEIAYEVGFKDPAYFSRVFTREFGMAPKVLRQKHHL